MRIPGLKKFKRPILTGIPEHKWEKKVFNPGITCDDKGGGTYNIFR